MKPTLKSFREERIKKEWEKFVIKTLCPAGRGHLRFEVWDLVEKSLASQIEFIKENIKYLIDMCHDEDMWSRRDLELELKNFLDFLEDK